MGCDPKRRCCLFVADVSIHAPAWGATVSTVSPSRSSSFQSTHPHGVRHLLEGTVWRRCKFQSTHPHGVRPPLLTRHGAPSGFNPRTRMGCDFMREERLKEARVSIHAPAWGATVAKCRPSCVLTSFNPRTRMGCDTSQRSPRPYLLCFNPRTRMGCDIALYSMLFPSSVSIHAPAWGATIHLCSLLLTT